MFDELKFRSFVSRPKNTLENVCLAAAANLSNTHNGTLGSILKSFAKIGVIRQLKKKIFETSLSAGDRTIR